MASNEGDAPKKVIDLADLVGDGSASEHLREQMERSGVLTGGSATERLRKDIDRLDTLTGSSRALEKALAPSTAIEKILKTHNAAFDVARALPDFSALTGIVDASHFEMQRIESLSEMNVLKGLHAYDLDPAARNLASSLNFLQNDAVMQMLESVRASQTAFHSAIGNYLDQHRAQAERISSMINALSIPRIDPSTFRINSALALSETNAFKIAGLTIDYTEQFRSITSALSEQLDAFTGIGLANRAFALQPDLVEGIGALLERALAEQEALLEQQRQPATETQPRKQTLIAERLSILNAIVSILFVMLSACLMLQEHLAGGDAATLKNTAAIEENTQTLEQMRGSFDALADQLERMSAAQKEASEDEMIADTAIAEILREIANTLTEQKGGQENAPELPD